MPKPKSLDRQHAILSAATHVIAVQGLGAATATIAREAGVSNGSLFGYFDTKATLLNALYVALKPEMGATVIAGLPVASDARDQVQHLWHQWLDWATSFPEKRRTLAHLQVSDDITAESHRIVSAGFSGMADLLERSRVNGPLKDAPLHFILRLTTAIAEATIDAIIGDPEHAVINRALAFDALWRILA